MIHRRIVRAKGNPNPRGPFTHWEIVALADSARFLLGEADLDDVTLELMGIEEDYLISVGALESALEKLERLAMGKPGVREKEKARGARTKKQSQRR
jgi:hypothetical protein